MVCSVVSPASSCLHVTSAYFSSTIVPPVSFDSMHLLRVSAPVCCMILSLRSFDCVATATLPSVNLNHVPWLILLRRESESCSKPDLTCDAERCLSTIAHSGGRSGPDLLLMMVKV